jgi:hypothetical protein
MLSMEYGVQANHKLMRVQKILPVHQSLYCVDASRLRLKKFIWLGAPIKASSMDNSFYRSAPAGRAVVCERCEDGWGDGEGHPTGLRTLQPRLWTSL